MSYSHELHTTANFTHGTNCINIGRPQNGHDAVEKPDLSSSSLRYPSLNNQQCNQLI
jgi:hypothetical protein